MRTPAPTVTAMPDFFEADGSLVGPGYTDAEAAALPERLRVPGVVIKSAAVPA